MALNPEKFSRISGKLGSIEKRESGRQELADVMAAIIGADDYYCTHELREKMENVIGSFPPEERANIVSELQDITKGAGWRMAHDIVAGALDLEKEIERTVGQREQIKIYRHTVKRPEEVQHFSDFLNPEGGPTHYWIPRKYDIQRYVKTAVEAHKRTGRSGTIKVLDIGGGAGLIGKLIADEAKNQGIDLEVTVMDPDAEIMKIARNTFSDTDNLRFEIGTSNQALYTFGPDLEAADESRFDELEKNRLEIIEHGKIELAHIKALLVSLEGLGNDEAANPDISLVLSGAFGNRAHSILEQSGVTSDDLPPVEQIRDILADYYSSKWDHYQQGLLDIRDEQERIYTKDGVSQSKIDLVINSWMPTGLDFTREIRMLNAPAIIYAREVSGITGVDYVGEWLENLGKEASYETGDSYSDISSWEGVATIAVKAPEFGYLPVASNECVIQIHSGIDISNEELEVPNPSKNEKYAWEESLEQLLGPERIRDKNFRDSFDESDHFSE
jgi:hypothetical protein